MESNHSSDFLSHHMCSLVTKNYRHDTVCVVTSANCRIVDSLGLSFDRNPRDIPWIPTILENRLMVPFSSHNTVPRLARVARPTTRTVLLIWSRRASELHSQTNYFKKIWEKETQKSFKGQNSSARASMAPCKRFTDRFVIGVAISWGAGALYESEPALHHLN